MANEKKDEAVMEIAKSMDELIKSYDQLAETYEEVSKAQDVINKSLDILAKDRDDIVDVLTYLDARLDELEKSAKNVQATMVSEKEEEDMDESSKKKHEIAEDNKDKDVEKTMKKMAPGVPTKTLATGDNKAPEMKGKENNIEQKSKETPEIPIPSDVKAPKALASGKSEFDPKSMIDEGPKLTKDSGFKEGVKVGEMNAIKKEAEEGIETPAPATVVDQNRDLSPLSKADVDLVNMGFGKIERLYRAGKLDQLTH